MLRAAIDETDAEFLVNKKWSDKNPTWGGAKKDERKCIALSPIRKGLKALQINLLGISQFYLIDLVVLTTVGGIDLGQNLQNLGFFGWTSLFENIHQLVGFRIKPYLHIVGGWSLFV